jgi:hypothetical protein
MLISLAGCSSTIEGAGGPDIEIVPISYSISLAKSNNSKVKLNRFLLSHSHDIYKQGLRIKWFSKEGKRWASQIKSSLLKKGVNSDGLIIEDASKVVSRFDIEVSFVKNEVLVSSCQPKVFGEVNSVEKYDGCYLSNIRWLSFVNPEYMQIENVNLVDK